MQTVCVFSVHDVCKVHLSLYTKFVIRSTNNNFHASKEEGASQPIYEYVLDRCCSYIATEQWLLERVPCGLFSTLQI